MRCMQFTLFAYLCLTVDSATLHGDELFTQRIAPLLRQHCLKCHSGDSPEGELSLESAMSLTESGVVVPGQPSQSRLLEVLTPHAGQAEMPKGKAPLSQAERELFRKWIEQGAIWPADHQLRADDAQAFDWWSFRPIVKPAIPKQPGDWALTPVDHFVLEKLKSLDLAPVEMADRRTLIRRVTYDLTGLPPTPEDVAQFDNDTDPQAYEKLVDRLLESPRYGERWASHWLDIVKYADTHGYDKDKLRTHAWPYRDYVIRSLNQDKPYAQFVQEQIAGDDLFPGNADGIQGLGFLAAGPWDFIGHVEVPESKIDGKIARNLDRDDMLANTLNTFCSLTVQCARCHDHKFDPIKQSDYYSLQAIFGAVDRANRDYSKDEEADCARSALTRQIDVLETSIAAKASEGEPNPTEREDQQRKLNEWKSYLAMLPAPKIVYAAATEFTPEGAFNPTHGARRVIHVLRRGDVTRPSALALPALLAIRANDNVSLDPGLSEGALRAALAEWITSLDNPLCWRSIVNRIWQYHFGAGLVGSPNDFGRMGELPTHPELLDWLAAEFRDGRQSMKSLHRLIVTSRTYQLAAKDYVKNASIDGTNRYLWRGNRRRLDAEEIRDSILAVSGELNLRMGGPGDFLFELEKTDHSPHYEYSKYDPGLAKLHRRSIYRFVVRSQPDPWMMLLDCADSSQSTPRRNETITSLQALTLLNSRFNLYMSECMANKIGQECADAPSQVKRAMQLALQREPTREEQAELQTYREQYGLANVCRVLFNLNEFVFLD